MSNQLLLSKAKNIANSIARPLAESVDREAQFPLEAIARLKDEGLLAAAIPARMGGFDASTVEVSAMCSALGQACGSTAVIFAMHQVQVACLVRHGLGTSFFCDYVREIVGQKWLIASGTSESGVGGDIRSSLAALEVSDSVLRLKKHCSTVSFGEQADAILTSARRSSEAAANDQVLVLLTKEDYQLEKTGIWNTLGLRGTCSPSFILRATASCDQVLPDPFRNIAIQTMVPYSHILWASAWLGIASDAVVTAQSLVRRFGIEKREVRHFSGLHLVDAVANLQTMAALIRESAEEYDRLVASANIAKLSSPSYSLRINNLKLESSRLVVQICLQCLSTCGLAGYTNNCEFSLGRQIRDSLAAPLMISNDRIAASNQGLLLVSAIPGC